MMNFQTSKVMDPIYKKSELLRFFIFTVNICKYIGTS